jgi:hypothetical protein
MENPQKQYPGISENSWISETAVIVGVRGVLHYNVIY